MSLVGDQCIDWANRITFFIPLRLYILKGDLCLVNRRHKLRIHLLSPLHLAPTSKSSSLYKPAVSDPLRGIRHVNYPALKDGACDYDDVVSHLAG